MAEDEVRDQFNPVRTAVVSQSIAPDARAGGMGDVGAATDPHARKSAFIEPAFIFLTYHFLAYYFWYYRFLTPIRGVAIYFLVPLAACFVWWYAVSRKRSNKMLELDKEIIDSEPIEQETETETINQEQENK